MVQFEHTLRTAEHRGSATPVGGDHLVGLDAVSAQQAGQLGDTRSAELMVVQPGNPLERVAERQVADLVDARHRLEQAWAATPDEVWATGLLAAREVGAAVIQV